jgi:hypothetical protein
MYKDITIKVCFFDVTFSVYLSLTHLHTRVNMSWDPLHFLSPFSLSITTDLRNFEVYIK